LGPKFGAFLINGSGRRFLIFESRNEGKYKKKDIGRDWLKSDKYQEEKRI
jgi:hypothetical protein